MEWVALAQSRDSWGKDESAKGKEKITTRRTC